MQLMKGGWLVLRNAMNGNAQEIALLQTIYTKFLQNEKKINK